MKYFYPVQLIFVVLLFMSCSKDGARNNQFPPSTDSIYLDKVYAIDDLNNDTVHVFSYTYDNQMRVINMEDRTSAFTNPPARSFSFYYVGNDTLPYKSVYVEQQSGGANTITIFHFKDGNGRNLKDSIINSGLGGPNTYLLSQYEYDGNTRVYINHHVGNYITPAAGFDIRRDTMILDNAGNIISGKRYMVNTSSGEWELSSMIDFSFDAYVSPFYILSNSSSLRYFSNGEPFFYQILNYNNPIGYNETYNINSSNPQNTHYNFINSYDANGKLVSAEMDGTHSNSPNDSGKLLFTYRAE